MSVIVKVEFAMELSEREYEIIQRLREMPEPRRISTENIIFDTPSLPQGIDTAALLAFFEDWRKELAPDDIKLMRAALEELNQFEDDEHVPSKSF